MPIAPTVLARVRRLNVSPRNKEVTVESVQPFDDGDEDTTTLARILSEAANVIGKSWIWNHDIVVQFRRSVFERNVKKPNWNEQEYICFWTSPTAVTIFGIVSLAVLTMQFWLLYAIFPILAVQILIVVWKWILYIEDDPELKMGLQFWRNWLNRLLNEGEQIISNQSAVHTLMAGAFCFTAPTGVSYIHMILRYKLQKVQQQVIAELEERHILSNDDEDEVAIRRTKTIMKHEEEKLAEQFSPSGERNNGYDQEVRLAEKSSIGKNSKQKVSPTNSIMQHYNIFRNNKNKSNTTHCTSSRSSNGEDESVDVSAKKTGLYHRYKKSMHL